MLPFSLSMDDGLVVSFLSEIVSEKRLRRIEEIIAQRTRYLTVVLEDIYQSQNASAVLRTCECFGLDMIFDVVRKYFSVGLQAVYLECHFEVTVEPIESQ